MSSSDKSVLPHVSEALVAVSKSIGAVGKNQRMEAGPARYQYRGLDDLLNAVHPALIEHGVTFAPHSVQMVNEIQGTTKSGSTTHLLRAIVTYRVYGPAGDYIESSVLAEGADTGDKAGNKLMSGAFKYVLGQVLCIPFSMEDQDASASEAMVDPERSADPGPRAPKKPVAKKAAAKEQPLNGTADLLVRLNDSALALGMDLEKITARFRKDNGDITYEQFLLLPAERIATFVRQVEEYSKEKTGAAQ